MYKILFFFLLPLFLIGVEKVLYQEIGNVEPPWLTGPLIAPSSRVVPLGDINIEPYVYGFAITGFYNGDWKSVGRSTLWANSSQTSIEIGVTPWMDVQLNPTVFWNYSEHSAHWVLGDMPIGIDIQLYAPAQGNGIPGIKLALREVLPLGPYNHLNPGDHNTRIGGGGSWNTGIGIVFGDLIHIYKVYYFNWRVFFQYSLPAPVRLKGFNIYGGGHGTNARFFPSESFQVDLGMELTLAQTWALALDVIGNWAGKDHYSGFSGVAPDGTPASLGTGASVQYSLAPAIEYNWNASLGLIAGAWFSVAGRNSPIFRSGVASLNYYY